MTRLSRSVAAQRKDLATLERLLVEAMESVSTRFWTTKTQRAAYEEVLRHVRLWAAWEDA